MSAKAVDVHLPRPRYSTHVPQEDTTRILARSCSITSNIPSLSISSQQSICEYYLRIPSSPFDISNNCVSRRLDITSLGQIYPSREDKVQTLSWSIQILDTTVRSLIYPSRAASIHYHNLLFPCFESISHSLFVFIPYDA